MIRRSLALAALVAATTSTAALAAPTDVTLRVEGHTQTIFEGPVRTDGKTIDKGSGPRPCDGTNGGVNPTPGPTMTSALDDGALANGFTWDGTWYSGFDDFGIDRIGPDATDNTNGRYWGYALNHTPVNIGGCQQKVQTGDEVLFGYDFFSKTHLLKLTGPARAAVGEGATVQVVDGQDGSAIAGASFPGRSELTAANGEATLTFDSPGTKTVKAERADSLRSNALSVCVYEPGSGDCGTTPAAPQNPGQPGEPGGPRQPPPPQQTPRDTTAPVAVVSSPRNRVYRRGRAPSLIRGTVDEANGIHQIYVRVRMIARGGCRWLSGRSERFTRPRSCAKARYIRVGRDASWSYQLPLALRGRARYIVDVKVLDLALNREWKQIRFRVR